MAHVLALDQGTTSSRAMIFDDAGRVCSSAQRELTQHYPQPGWVEHDPHEILSSQFDCARQAIAMAGLKAGDIAAIGIANQRETTVLWERATGRALAPAIVWQDRRTAQRCEQLREQGWSELVRERAGLEIDPYFSATKLAWLLDRLPDARVRAERGELAFGTIDSWLLWHLSGGRLHVTDASNASRTLLYDLQARNWGAVLLDCFGIPASVLPTVVDSIGQCGETDPEVFGAAIPIAGIGGDQQAATFGQCCFSPGMAKNTYGTGCFLLMNTGHEAVVSRHHLLTTVAWASAGEVCHALEGSVFMGGAVVQWLRDGLGVIERAADVQALAAQVPDAEGVVMVPAFTGLGAPYWDAQARGSMFGLTRGSSAAHLARAALDAIAQQTADLVEAMRLDGTGDLRELRVDGGAASNDLLMQIQADLLGVPVVRPQMLETTALGAAYLAGLGAGVWTDRGVLERQWVQDRVFEPQRNADWRATQRARWADAVACARNWRPT